MELNKKTSGFSLFEILIVVAILGVAARVVIPMLSSGDEEKLDVAAGEIIQALRYARSEAIRQSTCIEVNIEPDGTIPVSGLPTPTATTRNRVQIFRYSNCGLLPSSVLLVNPVDKKDYLFVMGTTPHTNGVNTKVVNVVPVSSNFPYRIYFYSDGSPRSYLQTGTTVVLGFTVPVFEYVAITTGSIQLAYNGKNRVINVSPAGKID